MKKKLFFGFKPFPRKGRAPKDVFNIGIGGFISKQDHESLIKNAKKIDIDKFN